MDTFDQRRRAPARPSLFHATAVPLAGAFTLIELLITIAVAALLAGVAVPSMRGLLLDQRMSSQINTLVGHINFGKSEAVMRNRQVVICKSADGQVCDARADWDEGWILFVDNDRNEHRAAGEPLLRRHGPLPAGLSLHYAGFPSSRYMSFAPTGITRVNGTFVFCDGRGPEKARAVVVSKTGRARTTARKAGGAPLVCPQGG